MRFWTFLILISIFCKINKVYLFDTFKRRTLAAAVLKDSKKFEMLHHFFVNWYFPRAYSVIDSYSHYFFLNEENTWPKKYTGKINLFGISLNYFLWNIFVLKLYWLWQVECSLHNKLRNNCESERNQPGCYLMVLIFSWLKPLNYPFFKQDYSTKNLNPLTTSRFSWINSSAHK